MLFDTATEFGRHVEEHLRKDLIIWLTVTCAQGCPAPNPLWFLWDGETFLFYNQPDARRLKHIETQPVVSLHFDTDAWGDDVVIFKGDAKVDPAAPPVSGCPEYLEKYREGIARLHITPEEYSEKFSVAVRVKPTHLRGQYVQDGETPKL